MTEQEKKKTVGYVNLHFADGDIDAEVEKIKSYASRHNMDLVEIVLDDGVVFNTLDRPGLEVVLDLVKRRTVDAVVACGVRQLTRSFRDAGELVEKYFNKKKTTKKNAELHIIDNNIDTSTGTGRLAMFNVAANLNHEDELFIENATLSFKRSRRDGEYLHRICRKIDDVKLNPGESAPYGYQVAADGVSLEERKDEQAFISLARTMRDEMFLFRKVAENLECYDCLVDS
jgi:DNA invertase Pin-like site-specific DNA recombinase